ncbi:hypothetical protein AB4J20_12430 [Pseudomonas aeruginosa]|uniref:hypothetical protein n=1 Tax=Pseudomonas aeruginosa TaxID=287 RepID=UPI003D02D2E4
MNDSLHKWWVFWASIVVPILLGCAIAITIIVDQGLYFTATYSGLITAYDFLKIPMWVGALSFPLTALTASIHRSAQTKKQIDVALQQNAFSNFYKHRDDFFKLLDSLEKENSISFESKINVYTLIFPANNFEFLDPRAHGKNGKGWIANFYKWLSIIDDELVRLCKTDKLEASNVSDFYLKMFFLGESLKIKFNEAEFKILYWIKPVGVIRFENNNVVAHLELLKRIVGAIADFSFYDGKAACSSKDISQSFSAAAHSLFVEGQRLGYMLYGGAPRTREVISLREEMGLHM